MKRKAFLGLSAASALGLTLSACAGTGSSGDAGNNGGGSTSLRFAAWDYAKSAEFKALVDGFTKANPSIGVEPVDIPAANYEDKITTMLAGGDTTDIIAIKNLTDFGGYMKKGQFLQVDDVVSGLETDKIPATDLYKYNDHYYGTAYRQDFHVLFYDTDKVSQAGIDPSTMTWDQLAEYAGKLTSGSGNNKVYGSYIHTWNSMVQGYAAAQQDKSYDEPDYAWMANQYNVTLGMQKAGTIMDYGTASSQQVSYTTMFESGKAVMVPMGTWLIGQLLTDKKAGTVKVKWGIAPIPQITAGGQVTTMGGPTGLGINKNSKNADAAKKFLAYCSSADAAAILAGVGSVPAYHSDAVTKAYFALDGMPTDDLSQKAFNPDVIRADGPTGPNASALGTVLNQEHQLIMTGSKTVDAGIAEMGSRVKSEVLNQ